MDTKEIDPIDHLKLVLARYRVTQEQVAEAIGVTDGTISRILNGSPTLPVVTKSIARWLSDHSAEYPVDLPKAEKP